MDILTLTPNYSAAHLKRRSELIAELGQIQARAHREAQAALNELAAIDSAYPLRYTVQGEGISGIHHT